MTIKIAKWAMAAVLGSLALAPARADVARTPGPERQQARIVGFRLQRTPLPIRAPASVNMRHRLIGPANLLA